MKFVVQAEPSPGKSDREQPFASHRAATSPAPIPCPRHTCERIQKRGHRAPCSHPLVSSYSFSPCRRYLLYRLTSRACVSLAHPRLTASGLTSHIHPACPVQPIDQTRNSANISQSACARRIRLLVRIPHATGALHCVSAALLPCHRQRFAPKTFPHRVLTSAAGVSCPSVHQCCQRSIQPVRVSRFPSNFRTAQRSDLPEWLLVPRSNNCNCSKCREFCPAVCKENLQSSYSKQNSLCN